MELLDFSSDQDQGLNLNLNPMHREKELIKACLFFLPVTANAVKDAAKRACPSSRAKDSNILSSDTIKGKNYSYFMLHAILCVLCTQWSLHTQR